MIYNGQREAVSAENKNFLVNRGNGGGPILLVYGGHNQVNLEEGLGGDSYRIER